MPKVKDLIKDSIWKNSEGFNDYTPEVTVILPTYSRGNNGLFESCVKSILNQTFKNFELIIVDDGSTDSTSQHIQNFMTKDNRIAWIRHPKNVGLPALSCNEAYLKARANKIFFAFDDNELETNAIQVLLDFHKLNSNVKVCYAATKVLTPNGKVEYLGADDFEMEKLWFGNNIPNGTVLVDKEVFENVGLYDPHIAITRLCDWDIWLRIGKKYHIHRVDAVLSTEKGPIQSDSLWYTHVRDYQLVLEWMSLNRNEELKPENLPEYDVTNVPENITYLSKTKIINLLQKKFKWLINDENLSSRLSMPQYGYLLVLGNYDKRFVCENIILINQPVHYLQNAIDLYLNASAVVFTGEATREYKKIVAFLKELKIPYYYNPENLQELLEKHSPEGIIEFIQRINYMTLHKTNLHIIKSNFKNLKFVFRKTVEHYKNKIFFNYSQDLRN